MVVGDFNIAPEDRDVYDPVAWGGGVLASPPEREAFRRLLGLGLHDAFRLFHDEAGRFSWWDYRAGAFRRNLGLRIDHILISEALRKACTACEIDPVPRGWERPSDHAPVYADFDAPASPCLLHPCSPRNDELIRCSLLACRSFVAPAMTD